MKSMQNRQQSHNILYGNCVDRINSSTKALQQCFSASSYGQNVPNQGHQSHFLYSTNVGGYRQSLSGSETDLSTSTENLTHEEKYVLRNSTRQEPQGEETLNVEDSCVGSGGGGGGVGTFRGGGSSYTSMDQSSCSTLIIHRDCEGDFEDEYEDDEEDDIRNSHMVDTRQKYSPNRSGLLYANEVRPELHHHTSANYYPGSAPYHHNCQLLQKQQQLLYLGQNSFPNNPFCKMEYVSHLPPEISGIPKQYLDQSEVLKHLAKEMHPSANVCPTQTLALNTLDVITPTSVSYGNHYGSNVGPAVSQAFFGTEFDLSKLPPPPEYPGHLNPQSKTNSTVTTPVTTDSSTASSPSSLQGSTPVSASPSFKASTPVTTTTTTSRSALSRSQPDLSQLGRWDDVGVRRNNYLSQRPKTKGKASPDLSPALLHQRAHDIKYGFGNFPSVDFLVMDKRIEAVEDENRRLKSELELYTSKVSKLQKFEVDIQKVHNAYEDLVKSSNKRDRLNQAVRTKLELEICRLQEQSKDLKEQLDAANNHLLRRHLPLDLDGNSDKREIQRRDQMIAQLIQQNKELMAAKERHEIELAAQRATLQEQRSHIEILDSALSNAQANVLKFEEECRKKQAYVERVAQLQKALTALQVASERREQMERKLRKQLELDLQELRQQQSFQEEARGGHQARSSKSSKKLQAGGNLDGHVDPSDKQSSQSSSGDCSKTVEAISDLKRAIREKEERIIALETEVSKWEQRYLEENAIRQIAIDAASMPKDAKIAALERTSQESEKLIAQARSEKLKQMDELHASNKRCADMESKIKDLESHLAERDAMIKVLQKHSMERDAALQNVMLRSPLHTPHPSFHTVTTSNTNTTTSIRGSSLSAVPADKASSSGLGSSAPVSLASMTPTTSTNSSTSESLDEQLKKLDSQLLSKDSIIHALRSEKEKYPSHYWMV